MGNLQQRDFKAAERLLRSILQMDRQNFNALHLLGLNYTKLGNLPQAVAMLREAAAVNDSFAPLHNNLGIALRESGELEAALACYERALALQPAYGEALINRGNVLRQMGRLDDALSCYDRALAINAENASAWNNRGLVLHELGRSGEALLSLDKALILRPAYGEAHFNRGRALEDLRGPQEALASYDEAVRVQPDHVEAWNHRGAALEDLNRPSEALASYDRAIALRPHFAEAVNNRGSALESLFRHQEALESYDLALALDPGKLEVLANRGHVLNYLGRHEEAAQAFARLLEQRPNHPYAMGDKLFSQLQVCDWTDYREQVAAVEAAVLEGRPAATPFSLLAISANARIQKKAAELFASDKYPAKPLLEAFDRAAQAQDRIRLAYVSADFHDHATAHLMVGLFERHDRTVFETWAFSFGPDLASPMRERLKNAFDHFVQVENVGDGEVARMMRECKIDIAVDLKGYTRDSRPGIFAFRPAPVQVSYLGYPGTTGMTSIDYLLADNVVVPATADTCYTECVIRLPGTYQVNSRSPMPAGEMPTRAKAGLPEDAFVFCCFNNSYKITPPVFDAWMRLLHQVERSVLWLLEDSPACSANLRREAGLRGVNGERLIFAPRVRLADHLARHRLADLFLDTLPVNAHTTASDALWSGLPVLTCPGEAFASRVAASLLLALGLPELVAADLQDYGHKALALATRGDLLQALRSRLAFNDAVHPLADVDAFRRPLESAFVAMCRSARQGARPHTFDIASTSEA